MNIKLKNKIKDNILRFAIWASAVLTLAVLLWIIIYIVSKGITGINWEFLSTAPFKNEGGILPMIVTTVYLVILSVVIAAPIGIAAAIYLAEYAKQGSKILRIIRFTIEILAGIPSIIYGLFGYLFFVITLGLQFSLWSGALTLAIMVLPTVIRTTEESIKTVPPEYKEGSLALGATKLHTIFKIIIPCSIPGIVTSIILSMGRIIGETAAVVFTAGTASRLPESLKESGQTLSVHLYLNAKEGGPLIRSFATATILIILIAFLNFLASKIGMHLKKFTLSEGADK